MTNEKKLQGLIIKAQSGFFTVETGPGFVVCQLRGKLKQGRAMGDIAALGDRVEFTLLADGSGVIENVEERKQALVRLDPRPQGKYQQVLLANADQAVFIFACANPNPKLKMLDRFLVIAEKEGPGPRVQLEAARAWSIWEGTTLSLLPEPERILRFGADAYALAFARIESHYFMNAGFFPRDGELLLEAGQLAGIPGTIIHGRYDVVTPVRSAVRLHQAWPGSQLRIVPDAGHAMTEPGIVHELIEATRMYAGC